MRKLAAAKPARKVKAKAIARPAEPAMDVTVGRRIRDLRRVRRFSLETVAAASGASAMHKGKAKVRRSLMSRKI